MKTDFHMLEIAELRRETPDATSFGLAVPTGLVDAFRFKPGQHIAVRARIDGEEVRRTYSITSAPGDRLLWITIKRVGDGVFSSWAHDALTAGKSLDCMEPAGRFILPREDTSGAARRIIAIAAGSGITPVACIIEYALAQSPGTNVTLLYGNRTVEDIIFRERLEGLKNRHIDRLQILHVLSRDSEADVPLLAGRIDADKITRLGPALRITPHDDILLCGPDTLIKAGRDAVLKLGADRKRIHFEYFKAGPQTAERRSQARATTASVTPAANVEVVAILDGMRRTFAVRDGEHIVDAALAAGIRVPYSCKGGMCCTCRAKLVEGHVVMDRNFSLQDWEMEAGFVLTCQSRPTTQRIVLDYDAA